MMSKVYDGSVNYFQVLDENGNVDQSLFPKGLDDSKIVQMYKYMLLARAVDNKALSLQRQGRMSTYGPAIGQEATQVGSAFAMGDDDAFVPNFRQHGVFIARGIPIERHFMLWKGFEEGNVIPKGVNGFPVIVPVATQIPHAVGLAQAFKYKKKNAAVITYVGDGGTSEGDFYEGMNFAGVYKVPVVIIIENNQWAISLPRAKQTASQTLAQKGIAAGLDCVQVDGNDLVAVYKAVAEGIEAAKAFKPRVIECVTYRMSMHTTADDPTKYRSAEEVAMWQKRDPIARIKNYLTKKKLWDDRMEQSTADEQLKLIDAAVEKAEQFKPDPADMFKHVYGYVPATLQAELDDAEASGWWQEAKE